MAAYEYRCETGHVTTITQSIHDELPATQVCAQCAAPAKRKFAATPAVFQAFGFYTTDRRGEGRV